MSLTIHCKYKYFDSTVQRAEDRRQKFHFCRLPFAVNVKLNLSNSTWLITSELANQRARKVLFTCVVYTNSDISKRWSRKTRGPDLGYLRTTPPPPPLIHTMRKLNVLFYNLALFQYFGEHTRRHTFGTFARRLNNLLLYQLQQLSIFANLCNQFLLTACSLQSITIGLLRLGRIELAEIVLNMLN